MIILDTSVILAYLFSSDNQHQLSKEKLKPFLDQELIISREIWQETIDVVASRYGSKVAIEVDQSLQKFVSHHDFLLDNSRVWSDVFVPLNPHRLSFTDCSLIYLSQTQKCHVLTLDKALEKHL